MDGNHIGVQIKRLRKAKKMTQDELAMRINVSKAAVSSYENGSRLPSYDILIKLAQMFRVSTDNLLGISNQYMIDATGLTLAQQNSLQEIIDAFRAYNETYPAE